MGYTMSQIQQQYNKVVDSYKMNMFTEVPCSSTVNYSMNGIYRSTDLKSPVNDIQSVCVKLVSRHSTLKEFTYPIYFIDLDVDKYTDFQSKQTDNHNRFYCIDDNYYTSDIEELKHARAVSLKRYIDFWDHRGKTAHLDIKKLSHSLIAYLRRAVDIKLGARTNVYTIRDVYFSYTALDRKLVVVIKHEDNYATEAFWFDPRSMAI
jgi:hypothetical protein